MKLGSFATYVDTFAFVKVAKNEETVWNIMVLDFTILLISSKRIAKSRNILNCDTLNSKFESGHQAFQRKIEILLYVHYYRSS